MEERKFTKTVLSCLKRHNIFQEETQFCCKLSTVVRNRNGQHQRASFIGLKLMFSLGRDTKPSLLSGHVFYRFLSSSIRRWTGKCQKVPLA